MKPEKSWIERLSKRVSKLNKLIPQFEMLYREIKEGMGDTNCTHRMALGMMFLILTVQVFAGASSSDVRTKTVLMIPLIDHIDHIDCESCEAEHTEESTNQDHPTESDHQPN